MIKYMSKSVTEFITEIRTFNKDGVAYGVGEYTVAQKTAEVFACF